MKQNLEREVGDTSFHLRLSRRLYYGMAEVDTGYSISDITRGLFLYIYEKRAIPSELIEYADRFASAAPGKRRRTSILKKDWNGE